MYKNEMGNFVLLSMFLQQAVDESVTPHWAVVKG